jgi:polysaccharide export outer membrane protein
MTRISFILTFFSSLAVLGGCGLLPTAGPGTMDVMLGQRDSHSLPYSLVKITPRVTAVLGKAKPRLAAFGDKRRPRDIRLGVGDVVSVTIFEASSGGLFIPAEASVRPGNFVTIPNQPVDVNGNITIPYAGQIRASGRTQVQVQQAIVDALKNRAIEPQVVVSLVDQRTSLITVLGDVGRPSRFPASATPERILDAIARAGGPSGPGADTWVMLERDGRREIAPFGALVYEPANNIYVHPNDTIYVYREPQTFLAFGALGVQQQIPFGAYVGSSGSQNASTWRLSLAEAVAKAGGLNDDRADPASVFLYRGETRDVAEALGIDCSPFEGPIIPVIYALNLRDPAGYFLASTFEMRNKDVIYVSNAYSVENTKFLTYLRTINSTVNDPINTAISVYTLKNLIRGTGTVSTSVLTGSAPIITVPSGP